MTTKHKLTRMLYMLPGIGEVSSERAAAALAPMIDALMESHSCAYTIGHPTATKPCPVCDIIKEFSE